MSLRIEIVNGVKVVTGDTPGVPVASVPGDGGSMVAFNAAALELITAALVSGSPSTFGTGTSPTPVQVITGISFNGDGSIATVQKKWLYLPANAIGS